MLKVILRAPLLTNSGYGVHSRQLFSWLYNRDDVNLTVECLQWGRTPWLLSSDIGGDIVDQIISCSKNIEPGTYDFSFQVQLPDEWDMSLAKVNVGVTAAVETDKCNPAWIEKCNQADHIIVPSTFTKNVLKRSGPLETKVTVIPEWFNVGIDNKSKNSINLNDDRFKKIKQKFNFLMIGTLTSKSPESDRKNLENTIKWICEEFKEDEDVGLVLKTNMGKGTTMDRALCEKYIFDMLEKHRKTSFPKFYFLHGNMKSEQVNALYAHPNIKAYVTATRGEGYGLPLVEAAASGLPIVATGWSGHLEFLDKDLFYDVDYNLKEIAESRLDNRIFVKGVRWAEPVKESFQRQCRSIYEDYTNAKEKAKKQKERVFKGFNSAKIKREYDRFLDGLLKNES